MPTSAPATYFDLLKQAKTQGADTPEDLQRAQSQGLTSTVDYNTNIAPDPTQFKKLNQVEPQQGQSELDPVQTQQALFAAQQSSKPDNPSSGTYDFDSAIRARLGGINDIGNQQNNVVQQRALAAQQSQYSGLQSQYNKAGQAGVENGVAGSYAGDGTFVPSRNPRSAQEAIAWAKQAAANGDSGWYRRCLAFVAQAYGLPSSGTNYAIDAFNRLPAGQKFTDRNPTPGALMFWKGSSAPGHVAIYLGNGMIASTDISGAGKIGIVAMNAPETKWGQKYVGWSLPNFATTRK